MKLIFRLRQTNFKIKFVTNTTKESKSLIHNKLNQFNLAIDKNEIFTSLSAARQLVEKKQLRPLLFLEPEALEDFEGNFWDENVSLIRFKEKIIDLGIDTENPNSVVVGLAPSKFDYEHLNQAFK